MKIRKHGLTQFEWVEKKSRNWSYFSIQCSLPWTKAYALRPRVARGLRFWAVRACRQRATIFISISTFTRYSRSLKVCFLNVFYWNNISSDCVWAVLQTELAISIRIEVGNSWIFWFQNHHNFKYKRSSIEQCWQTYSMHRSLFDAKKNRVRNQTCVHLILVRT